MGPIEADTARFLIDTHVLLWWFFGDARLSPRAYDIIQSPDHAIFVSSASGWEISTKHRLGKLPHAAEAVDNLPALEAFAYGSLADHPGTCPCGRRSPRTSP